MKYIGEIYSNIDNLCMLFSCNLRRILPYSPKLQNMMEFKSGYHFMIAKDQMDSKLEEYKF